MKFHCINCDRNFKSLSHFNKSSNLACIPMLDGDGRKTRYYVLKKDEKTGLWTYEKRKTDSQKTTQKTTKKKKLKKSNVTKAVKKVKEKKATIELIKSHLENIDDQIGNIDDIIGDIHGLLEKL